MGQNSQNGAIATTKKNLRQGKISQNEQKQPKMRRTNQAHIKKPKIAKSRYKMIQKIHKAIQKS